jgi:hypothetical protein
MRFRSRISRWKRPGRLRLLRVVVLVTAALQQPSLFGQQVAPDTAQLEFFESRIRPVLVKHCYQCHAADAKNIRGGLLLDSLEGSRAGGDSGPAVVPGDPEESLLLSALRYESFEMPPDQRLADSVIADFEQWIQDGAVDPRVGGTVHQQETLDVAEGRKFWSFQPVGNPAVPTAGDGWAHSDIDRFIAATHQQHQVTAAADAPAGVLARRLYYVLTGLPPSIDQLRQFEDAYRDDPETSLAETVDSLLASHHFGERWGRHWLDVARFAESSGGGRSLMFPDAWRFRDYVIKAFNEDRPFNQLIREHIAGDLLPAASAAEHDQFATGAGYLVLGPINYEEQDKEFLRMNVVDEQIDTVGRTFLGMTLGCARCHDHKFDPVPTADYYALAGVFRSTQTLTPGNVSGYVTAELQDGRDEDSIANWQQKQDRLQRQLEALRRQAGQSASRAVSSTDLPGVVVDDSEAVFSGEWTKSSHSKPYVDGGYSHSGHGKTGQTARYEAFLPDAGVYAVRVAYNSQSSRSPHVPVFIQHADGTATAALNQHQRPDTDGVFAELGRYRFSVDKPAVVTLDAVNAAPGYVIADAVQFLPVELIKNEEQIRIPPAELLKSLTQVEAQLKKHAKAKPPAAVVMSVRDDQQPEDWYVHVRGEIRNLGERVPRGFLTAATPEIWTDDATPQAAWDIPQAESGRRQLAEWLADPDNPLTTRVFVNRVWMHVMGEGLVRTPDNFGRTGRPPTHPELLDHLARTFVEDDDWSVKSLVRRLCLSRTFRMSSAPPAGWQQRDPDNLWWAHAVRRQRDAESLRDAMLFTSGELDLTVRSGRTIGKLTTYDNAYDHSRFSFRGRSVYVPWFRNAMLDLFGVFNTANPNLVTGKRNRSVLPSQALFLMNSPFVMEQSESAAKRLLAEASNSDGQLDLLIETAWRRTLSRVPTADERDSVKALPAGNWNSVAGRVDDGIPCTVCDAGFSLHRVKGGGPQSDSPDMQFGSGACNHAHSTAPSPAWEIFECKHVLPVAVNCCKERDAGSAALP